MFLSEIELSAASLGWSGRTQFDFR